MMPSASRRKPIIDQILLFFCICYFDLKSIHFCVNLPLFLKTIKNLLMKFIAPIIGLLFFTACGQNDNTSTTSTANAAATTKNTAASYQYEDIAGAATKRAFKKDGNGNVIEDGFMLDGQKTGMWSFFQKQFTFPKRMTSFQNGKKNGPHYEYTERGTVVLKENYINGQLNGYWARFKFSKPIEEAVYKYGVLDGPFREYDPRKNFLFKETMYSNGKIHGTIKFLNEAGEVTMQYEYKNGEKVSGGIVK